MTVPVMNEDGDVIAEVKYNADLDHWDGHDYTCGSTGRHKGLAQLDDGRYVLIHGTQFQGERDSAEIISPNKAAQEILRSGNVKLFDIYPELQEIRESLPSDKLDARMTRSFSVRINKNATPDEIEKKIVDLRAKMDLFIKS